MRHQQQAIIIGLFGALVVVGGAGCSDETTASETVVDASADTLGPETLVVPDVPAAETASPDSHTDIEPDAGPDSKPDVGSDAVVDPNAGSDASSDIESDVPTSSCTATVKVTDPIDRDFHLSSHPLVVKATVIEPSTADLSVYSVDWLDEDGAILANSAVESDGSTTATLVDLASGERTLHPVARDAGGRCPWPGAFVVTVCRLEVSEDFDTSLPAAWSIYGDAFWDNNGWLEMTDAAPGRRGAIYNSEEYVRPGTVSVRFDIQTGGGSGSGADGFAVSIVEAYEVAELEALLPVMADGGGLGYGAGGDYGSYDGEAFTVEIDTWYNHRNGHNEPHTDPTESDHLEFTAGLDPGNSLAWVDVGEVEDMEWHKVRVDIIAPRLRVWYDDVLHIDQDVSGLRFRGGFIMFTGSTGYHTNYHRFDQLRLIHACDAMTD